MTVTAAPHTAATDKEGNYTFEKIPYGPYSVVAKLAETKGPVDFGVQTGTMLYDTAQVSVKVDKDSVTAPEIKLKPPSTHIRSVVVNGHVSLDCSVSDWGTTHYPYYGPIGETTIDLGNGHPQDSWSTDVSVHSADARLYATFNYQPDDSVSVFFKAVLDSQYERDYTTTIAPGDDYTFTIGNTSSFLNGRAGYTYDGYPDLEGNNDTMCCAITFANKEWTA